MRPGDERTLEEVVDDYRARRRERAAQAPAQAARVLADLEAHGVPHHDALVALQEIWNLGWHAGFRDANDDTMSREPFQAE
jgi:hypothetical protein